MKYEEIEKHKIKCKRNDNISLTFFIIFMCTIILSPLIIIILLLKYDNSTTFKEKYLPNFIKEYRNKIYSKISDRFFFYSQKNKDFLIKILDRNIENIVTKKFEDYYNDIIKINQILEIDLSEEQSFLSNWSSTNEAYEYIKNQIKLNNIPYYWEAMKFNNFCNDFLSEYRFFSLRSEYIYKNSNKSLKTYHVYLQVFGRFLIYIANTFDKYTKTGKWDLQLSSFLFFTELNDLICKLLKLNTNNGRIFYFNKITSFEQISELLEILEEFIVKYTDYIQKNLSNEIFDFDEVVFSDFRDIHFNRNKIIAIKSNYLNHCWKCGRLIDSQINLKCKKCNQFYVCSNCGSCLCDWPNYNGKK